MIDNEYNSTNVMRYYKMYNSNGATYYTYIEP